MTWSPTVARHDHLHLLRVCTHLRLPLVQSLTTNQDVQLRLSQTHPPVPDPADLLTVLPALPLHLILPLMYFYNGED